MSTCKAAAPQHSEQCSSPVEGYLALVAEARQVTRDLVVAALAAPACRCSYRHYVLTTDIPINKHQHCEAVTLHLTHLLLGNGHQKDAPFYAGTAEHTTFNRYSLAFNHRACMQ